MGCMKLDSETGNTLIIDYGCIQVDQGKIEVIKWLVFEESQRAEAIVQGNALMRQFLGKIQPYGV